MKIIFNLHCIRQSTPLMILGQELSVFELIIIIPVWLSIFLIHSQFYHQVSTLQDTLSCKKSDHNKLNMLLNYYVESTDLRRVHLYAGMPV